MERKKDKTKKKKRITIIVQEDKQHFQGYK